MKTADEIRDYCRRHKYSDEYTSFWMLHRFCRVCGMPASAPHHVKSRGSGGDDDSRNLLALCREHHLIIESIGDLEFGRRYGLEAQIAAALERGET